MKLPIGKFPVLLPRFLKVIGAGVAASIWVSPPAIGAPFTLDCAAPTYHVHVTIDYASNTVVSFVYVRENGSTYAPPGFPKPATVTATSISWVMSWRPGGDVTETINRTTGTLYDVNPYPYSVTPAPCQKYTGAPPAKF